MKDKNSLDDNLEKKYNIKQSLKMIVNGFCGMIKDYMRLSPFLFVFLAVLGAIGLVFFYDNTVRALDWLGIYFHK